MIRLLLLLSIVVFISGCREYVSPELQSPNIIFLVSEDNSPFLGCYGDSLSNTPNLDAFAEQGVRFINAFANAPVCAPSRSTIISGMYATSMGTQHMRSENPSPEFMRFFPYYLKKAGYYTSNRVKKDYNTIDQDSVWDITDWWGWKDALKGKKEDQPFFMMYNTWMSHESKIHPNADNYSYFSGTMKEHGVDSVQIQKWWDEAKFDTKDIKLPAYHPNTPEMKADWAKYYECVELMDREMGVVLNRIKEDGYWENSIIFYFSDHGGVLARSKRFVFDSGLRVPFIIYIPNKYKSLISREIEAESDNVISFVDLAPTVLTLAGIEVPSYFEGKSFLKDTQKNDYAFGFRGRMDERYDMVRTVRDERYRYIRNYMPHRISGGKIQYLWKARSIKSWKEAFQQGKCNKSQSSFWETKPFEELYDCYNDPDNVNNLVDDSKYQNELNRFRKVLDDHLRETKDLGFIPEGEMVHRSAESTPYDFIRSDEFSFDRVFETANLAAEGKIKNINILKKRLSDIEPVVRYWAATGCAVLKEQSSSVKKELLSLLNDESPSVRIAAAEALFHLGEKEMSIEVLKKILQLPKMKKEDPLSNKELYANHFAITHALNVIDVLSINTPEIKKIVNQIANSERANKRDYDRRIAQNIIQSYLTNSGISDEIQ
ncbi:MAG: sulfatase-like hydrolase/transferase [Bacteroidota bacterium]